MIKKIFGLLLMSFLLIVSVIFSGCNKQTNSNSSLELTASSEGAQVVELTKKQYEIPNELFVTAKINNDELVALKDEDKNIYQYNYKTKVQKVLAENTTDKFVHAVRANSEWLIWVQDEAHVRQGEKAPFDWEIIAMNIASGERYIVDKTSYISAKFEVPSFVDYSPSELELDGNLIVYTKTVPNGKNISSEIKMFNLTSQEGTLIAKTSNVMEEYIVNCHVNNNKIVWNMYNKFNENFEKRQTQYVFSDLYLYDIASKKSEKLSENKFWDKPKIYGNKIVAVDVPEKKPIQAACESDIILVDMNTKEITPIVNDKSPCYSTPVAGLYRNIPNITDTYVSWYDVGRGNNKCLYDYVNNKFVKIYENTVSGSEVRIVSMLGNIVLVHDSMETDSLGKTVCIDLN